jgi:hypothetical protein
VLVWKYHGICEAVEAAKLADSTNADLAQAKTLADGILQKIEGHPLFAAQSSTAQGRIRKGQIGCLLHDEEILAIRGIKPKYYNLPRKVLSNLAHFSSFSVSIMNATNRDWSLSWNEFLLPTYHVLRFASEGLTVFRRSFSRNRSSHLCRGETAHGQLSKYSSLKSSQLRSSASFWCPSAKRRKKPTTGTKDKRLLVSLAPAYEACTMTRH